MFSIIFGKIGSWIWGMVALLGTIAYLFSKVASMSADADDLRESREALKAARERKKTDEEVDSLSDDDVVSRLRRNGWYRDN